MARLPLLDAAAKKASPALLSALLSVCAIHPLVSGCGGTSSPGEPDAGDASPADSAITDSAITDSASTDGATPGFDPSVTYPGEGNACSFSVYCGERQICVDDQCIRHERVRAEDLMLGELRPLAPTDLLTSPFYAEAYAPLGCDQHVDWDDWMEARVLPGAEGPEAAIFHETATGTCQVMIYGARLRFLEVPGGRCTSVALAPTGEVLVGSKDAEHNGLFTLFGPDDALLQQLPIPETVHAAASAERGAGALAGRPASLAWDGDHFVATLPLKHPDLCGVGRMVPAYYRTVAFADVYLDGRVEPHLAGGSVTHDGGLGYLVRGPSGLSALLTSYSPVTRPCEAPSGPSSMDRLDLEDGTRALLHEGVSLGGHTYQPRADEWYYVAWDHPEACARSLFHEAGMEPLRTSIDLTTRVCPASIWLTPYAQQIMPIAVVSGHHLVRTSSLHIDRATGGRNLILDPGGRTEPILVPDGLSLHSSSHLVAARYGKTFEVFFGCFQEGLDPSSTEIRFMEAALRTMP